MSARSGCRLEVGRHGLIGERSNVLRGGDDRFREDGGRLYNAAQDDYALPADMQEINVSRQTLINPSSEDELILLIPLSTRNIHSV